MSGLKWVLLLMCLGMLAGCASPPPAENSMPWNTPQSWEGAPALPFASE